MKKLQIKSNFKCLICLIVALNLQSFIIRAQPRCNYQNTLTSSASSVIQPTNCINLLNDFVVSANDRTLDVNVNFWVFASPTNSSLSAWTHTAYPMTQAKLQTFLDNANTILTTLPPTPKLTVAGTPLNIAQC